MRPNLEAWGVTSVDEVADLGQQCFVEFNAEQFCAGAGEQLFFKSLQHAARQVSLSTEKPDEGGTVGRELIIARQPAGGLQRERKLNGPR